MDPALGRLGTTPTTRVTNDGVCKRGCRSPFRTPSLSVALLQGPRRRSRWCPPSLRPCACRRGAGRLAFQSPSLRPRTPRLLGVEVRPHRSPSEGAPATGWGGPPSPARSAAEAPSPPPERRPEDCDDPLGPTSPRAHVITCSGDFRGCGNFTGFGWLERPRTDALERPQGLQRAQECRPSWPRQAF